MDNKTAAIMARHEVNCIDAFARIFSDGFVLVMSEYPSQVKHPDFASFLQRIDGYVSNIFEASVLYATPVEGYAAVIMPYRGKTFRDPEKRKQVSIKLSYYTDLDIIQFLDRHENVQGLIKSLIRDHIAALNLKGETEDDKA